MDDESQSPDEVFWTAVGVETALGVIAIVLGLWWGPDARDLVPPATRDAIPALLGGLGLGVLATFPLLGLIAAVRRIDHPAIAELDRMGDLPMIRSLLKLRPVELFVISVCAGVGEELLFRGWLMPAIAGDKAGLTLTGDVDAVRWWATGGYLSSVGQFSDIHWAGFEAWWTSIDGRWLITGWLVSSLVFGLFHPITKLYIALTAVMGLYFGALLILTGNLLIPITAHALYDAVQLWSAAGEQRSTAPEKSQKS